MKTTCYLTLGLVLSLGPAAVAAMGRCPEDYRMEQRRLMHRATQEGDRAQARHHLRELVKCRYLDARSPFGHL